MIVLMFTLLHKFVKTNRPVHSKRVNFIACKIYLKPIIKKKKKNERMPFATTW